MGTQVSTPTASNDSIRIAASPALDSSVAVPTASSNDDDGVGDGDRASIDFQLRQAGLLDHFILDKGEKHGKSAYNRILKFLYHSGNPHYFVHGRSSNLYRLENM